MPSDAKVDLFYNSTWNDITKDSLGRDGISISHGQQDEGSASDPSSCTLSVWNATSRVNTAITGRYTPRNPLSDLYGKISRNSKIRARVASTTREGLRLTGVSGSYASTPDHSSLDITGDIDIRVELTPEKWRPTVDEMIVTKYQSSGDNRSYLLKLKPDGTLLLNWSPNGTLASLLSATSTAAVPDDGARRAVRVTMDVDNGASQRVITFYTSMSITGTWTQLGTAVTQSGVTSIFSGASPVEVGSGNGGGEVFTGQATLDGRVHKVEIRNGIGGTVAADPDFSARDGDDRSFTDGAGRVWTVQSQAWISRPDIRGCGGVSSWPPRWDVSGNDLWVPIEANGPFRRLSQGASALRSSLFRDLSTKSNIAAYWPCEDGEDSVTISAAIGSRDLTAIGDVTLASAGDIDGSDALPEFGTGTLAGMVPMYADPVDQRLMGLIKVPDTVPGTERTLLHVQSTGTVKRWKLRLTNTGAIVLKGYDKDEVEVVSGTHSVNLLGKVAIIWLWLAKNGTATDWQIGSVEPKQTGTIPVVAGSVASASPGRFWTMQVGSGADLGGTVIGHVALMTSDVHGAFWDTVKNSLIAWSGEQAHARFERLCKEEGISCVVRGSESELMGAQTRLTLLDLWQQCADTDMGLLNETGCDGWLFRTHTTLQHQTPKITLDYDLGHLTPPLEPTDDDQSLRNDVTVTRTDGSSYRAKLDTGTLSIADAGRYDESVELSLADDSQLEGQAWWRLSLGTWDAARYPSVTIGQLRTSSLRAQVLSIEEGDLIRITNLPSWLPPDDVDLIVLGRNEVITADGLHTITFVCVPGEPWDTWVIGDGKRLQTGGSQLTSGITSSATSISVTTTVGAVWIDSAAYAAMFPFGIKIGGEVMTVTGITGTSSPQTFTVTRSVNGVVKSHSAGAVVKVAKPARPSL